MNIEEKSKEIAVSSYRRLVELMERAEYGDIAYRDVLERVYKSFFPPTIMLATSWSIDDIREDCPGLTEEELVEVLKGLHKGLEMVAVEEGHNWIGYELEDEVK